jgi:hypothetical protein
MTCEAKLFKTYEFRSHLLLAEQTFATETASGHNSEVLSPQEMDSLSGLDIQPAIEIPGEEHHALKTTGPSTDLPTRKYIYRNVITL